jgi:OOP family OmpA-OmpF porin
MKHPHDPPQRAIRIAASALALTTALTFEPASALAQQATALERLEPAPASDALVAVPSAEVVGHLLPTTGLLVSYAEAPLSLKRDGGDNENLGDIVDHQVTLHVLASVALWDRLRLDFDVPLTLSQTGEFGGGAQFPSPGDASLNDIRGALRLELLPQQGSYPAAALAFSAWLPTGNESAYTGTGSTRFAPSIVVAHETSSLVWSATVGRRFESAAAPGLLGSEVMFGAGLAPRFGAFQIGPEVFGTTVADGGTTAFSRRTTSLEALLAARYRVGPVTLTAGAGPGLSAGIGTPEFRVIGGVALTPRGSEKKGEQHPVARPAPVPKSSSPIPPQDRDGDTVLDAADACPDVVGEPSATPPGCPADRDRDGIVDAEDACIDVPGVPSTTPGKNGCPSDRDGDGIVDAEDACVNEKGPKTTDPKTNGCPASVRLEGEQIIILEQVHFATARHEIKPESFELLTQVAGVLQQHPEIARLAVDGHTDSRGVEKDNVALSQRRALSVVRWLIEHGVDARRIEARGFGPRRPIADNGTDAGRAKNRRVEFQIRKRTNEGEAGWRDGPIE